MCLVCWPKRTTTTLPVRFAYADLHIREGWKRKKIAFPVLSPSTAEGRPNKIAGQISRQIEEPPVWLRAIDINDAAIYELQGHPSLAIQRHWDHDHHKSNSCQKCHVTHTAGLVQFHLRKIMTFIIVILISENYKRKGPTFANVSSYQIAILEDLKKTNVLLTSRNLATSVQN